ncbi:hypothetical protein GCM10010339_86040 [Streptomyces alanosinicus]|uniref:Uncharacterized protein n=1 Tax=Streptomyces alanosinicus TaxID=68171 RepID=A0A918YTH2_9ACTN|nr:hypothetical protein GCM10010339_86040 [Streptomyces alanosinicus]
MTTLGWVYGEAMAAAGRVVPCASQTPAIASARATRSGGASFPSGGQDVVQCRLVQERVAAGEHHHVGGGLPQEAGEHRRLVHAGADRADHALVAQVRERGRGFLGGLPPVVVRIVEIDDVEAVQARAAEGAFDRTQDAVAAEVPAAAQVVGNGEALVVHAPGPGIGHEEAADLGGQDVFVAEGGGAGRRQGVPRTDPGRSGGGVEVADAGLPGRIDGGHRVLGRGGLVEVADDGGAEAEFAERDGRVGDLALLQGVLLGKCEGRRRSASGVGVGGGRVGDGHLPSHPPSTGRTTPCT